MTYRSQDWQVTLTPRSGDGGVDIIATRSDVGAIRILDKSNSINPATLYLRTMSAPCGACSTRISGPQRRTSQQRRALLPAFNKSLPIGCLPDWSFAMPLRCETGCSDAFAGNRKTGLIGGAHPSPLVRRPQPDQIPMVTVEGIVRVA